MCSATGYPPLWRQLLGPNRCQCHGTAHALFWPPGGRLISRLQCGNMIAEHSIVNPDSFVDPSILEVNWRMVSAPACGL